MTSSNNVTILVTNMAANSKFAMATHIMSALALSPEKVFNSSYLAGSLNTNPVVVRRILSDLQKANLLETLPGRRGGAKIGKNLNTITLQDIYNAIDGSEIFAYNPNDPNKKCPLSCTMKSILEPVFSSAKQALAQNLKQMKLIDVVKHIKKEMT